MLEGTAGSSAVFGSIRTGGGESIAMTPLHGGTPWLSGESDTVALDSPPLMLVAVPMHALILDQDQRWVMVHTA